MITYNYETEFVLENETQLESWIEKVVSEKGFELGEINYIFCDDEYLLKLNVEFLQHDTLTDIISFDNSLGNLINGDIFISVERVNDNAKEYIPKCIIDPPLLLLLDITEFYNERPPFIELLNTEQRIITSIEDIITTTNFKKG